VVGVLDYMEWSRAKKICGGLLYDSADFTPVLFPGTLHSALS